MLFSILKLSSVQMICSCIFVNFALQQIFAEAEIRLPHSCWPGYYKTSKSDSKKTGYQICKTCSACPIGQGIKQKCTSESDTLCQTCIDGKTFSNGWGQNNYCRSCKVCGPHREVVKQCTVSSNTVCGNCLLGYYWDDIYSTCRPCSSCLSEFGNSYDSYVVRECIHSKIPAKYSCVELLGTYQKSWISDLTASEDNIGSGEFSGGSFPSDDEEDVSSRKFPTSGDKSDEMFPSTLTILQDETPRDFPADQEKDKATNLQTAKKMPTLSQDSTLVLSDNKSHNDSKITLSSSSENLWQKISGQSTNRQANRTTFIESTLQIFTTGTKYNSNNAEKKQNENFLGSDNYSKLNYNLIGAVSGLSVLSLVLLCSLVWVVNKFLLLKRKINNDTIRDSDTEMSFDENIVC